MKVTLMKGNGLGKELRILQMGKELKLCGKKAIQYMEPTTIQMETDMKVTLMKNGKGLVKVQCIMQMEKYAVVYGKQTSQ
ncbi:hypothetical protein [Bacteroides sp. Ga6A1]|uniref:hypothetical protein n=1 Tax=Bacteroides sp. Ga6A1 TaxID=1410607 RepID=UPI0018CC03B2|nr:hypothetical protein [Bacteroides sp. Ga6A1]